jgi:hypothetical protein
LYARVGYTVHYESIDSSRHERLEIECEFFTTIIQEIV